jgi:hypothetical protein
VHAAELVQVMTSIFNFMKELESNETVVSKVYAMASAVSML